MVIAKQTTEKLYRNLFENVKTLSLKLKKHNPSVAFSYGVMTNKNQVMLSHLMHDKRSKDTYSIRLCLSIAEFYSVCTLLRRWSSSLDYS